MAIQPSRYGISPRHAHYFPNEETDLSLSCAHRKNALPERVVVPRRRRLTLAAAFLSRGRGASTNADPRRPRTTTRERQEQQTSAIYIRGARNERAAGQPYYYRLFAVRVSVIMILFLWT